MAQIIAIVHQTGALQATRDAAAVEARRALDALQALPQNVYSDALTQLASQLLARRS
jgi:octaprenyl-diphosphate synthase